MYYREIKSAVPVAEEDVHQLQETVKSILARVKTKGDKAVRYYEKEFDNYDPPSFRISEEQAARAVEQLPAEVVEELDFAIEQVTAFARAQKDSLVEFEKDIRPGMRMGQRIIPVDSCGCYVPASLKLAKFAETHGAYEGMDAHRFAAAIRLDNLKG